VAAVTRVRTREWSSTDYYGVLGVDRAAPATEIDNRYRELAKSLHPDRSADVDDQERFKRVSVAYSALKDPNTRRAYDEFRSRVAEGRLYAPRATTTTTDRRRVDHLAPARVPKARRPMPTWLRRTIAAVLVALGLFGIGWAAFGALPAPRSTDTPVAVQVTLVIMGLKFLAGGVIVAWYPQLRARWHH
jgi:hypothetical protein